jgi:hypothetical protein
MGEHLKALCIFLCKQDSRHCSRPFPKVIAIENGKPRIVKQREAFEQIIDFWR